MLCQLPGQLYLDISKRDVLLSRLYYMNTPRRAMDAIITLLMLRELTCQQLGIEMKPMIESEYGLDVVPAEHDEEGMESPIYLSTAKGQKIDMIRTLNVMYEQGRFKGKDGRKLTKKEFFIWMGKVLNVDLSDGGDWYLSRTTTALARADCKGGVCIGLADNYQFIVWQVVPD